MKRLIVDDYNDDPDPGERQPPILSAAEQKAVYKEFWNFVFFQHLMQPYSFPDYLFTGMGRKKSDLEMVSDLPIDEFFGVSRKYMEGVDG